MTCNTRRAACLLRLLMLGVTGLLVLSGCGAGGDSGEWADDSGIDPAEARVTPRPGMIDVEPVRIWYEYGRELSDDHAVLVTFASQGPPCQVLDRVEVDETDIRVTITLYHGRDPDGDPDASCDGPLRVFEVEVPLSAEPPSPDDGGIINGGSLTDRIEFEAIVEPRPGMVDVEPVTWWYDFGQVDDHTMLVTFPSQGPPCQVLDHVEVDETDTHATITLHRGRDPDGDPEATCDGPIQVVGVEVPLSRSYGPAGVSRYTQAGIWAETGEGPIVNGGSPTPE